jgi:hypothetical protein
MYNLPTDLDDNYVNKPCAENGCQGALFQFTLNCHCQQRQLLVWSEEANNSESDSDSDSLIAPTPPNSGDESEGEGGEEEGQ